MAKKVASREQLFTDLKLRDSLMGEERELQVAVEELKADIDWEKDDAKDPKFVNYKAKYDEIGRVRRDLQSVNERIKFSKAALPIGTPISPEAELVKRGVKQFFGANSDQNGVLANMDSETQSELTDGQNSLSLGLAEIETYLQTFYAPHLSAASLKATDATGEETVQTDVASYPVLRQKYFQGILAVANLFYRVGGPFQMPKWDVTGRRSKQHAEGLDQDVTTPASFTEETISGFMLSDAASITAMFLRHTQLANPELLIMEMLLSGWFRELADEMVTGAGTVVSSKRTAVQGLNYLAHTSDTVTPKAGTGLSFDNLIDLRQELDPSYRMGGGMQGPSIPSYTSMEMLLGEDIMFGPRDMGTCWLFNSTTEGLIAKMKVSTTDSRPLWLEAFAMGLPVNILGFPYKIVQQLSSFAAATPNTGEPPIVFGDTSHIITRIGAPISVRRDDDALTRLGLTSRGLNSGSILFSIQSEYDQIFGASDGEATPKCDAILGLKLS